jgi:glycosyltransferase involved in cell wall biosynthesis
MKLLFIYRFCGLGGVETSIVNKLDALQSEGIQAEALLGEPFGSGGASLAADPRITLGFTVDGLRVRLRKGFDAISVIDNPDLVDLLAECSGTTPILFETHASLSSAAVRFHRNLDHPRISAIVVPSHFNEQMACARLTTPKPVVVIRNPINPAFLANASGKGTGLGLPGVGPVLLWVGRLEKEKNPVEFLRAAALLLNQGLPIRALVIGDAPSDHEYDSATAALLAEVPAQWSSLVTFRRQVPYENMPAAYRLAASSGGCLVSTSLNESAPMTFLEAMSSLCPVVSSRVGGVEELLLDGRTGYLYESGSVSEAAASIAALLDPGRTAARRALTERAQRAVLQRHAPATFARSYSSLVASLHPAATPDRMNDPSSDDKILPGLVSTIIPVFNRADLLLQAVESVLSQTYANIEIILVNDGSTDDTASLCDRLAAEYPAVRVRHIPHSGRAGTAREAGRQLARGEYIQYLDSDDLLKPEKFTRLVAALKANPACDIVYCGTRRYRMESAPADVAAELTGQSFETMLPAFLSKRYWCTSTPLYRRRLCDQAGPWADLRFWEDIEYDLRLAALSPRLCHVPDLLTDMRDHDCGRLSGSRFLENADSLAHAVRGAVLIYGNVKRAGLPYADEHMRRFIDDLRLVYERCVHFNLEPEAAEIAAVIADATGVSDRSRIADYRVRARIEPKIVAIRALHGQTLKCPVWVTNESTVDFHAGEFATELAYHIRNADGSMAKFDNPKIIFEQPLHPQETCVIQLPIDAPHATGIYYLELDILWASAVWLSTIGNPPAYVKLLVSETAFDQTWWVHTENGNAAALVHPADQPGIARLTVTRAENSLPWATQVNYERIEVTAGCRYSLRFRARAVEPRTVKVGVSRAHATWDNLGLYAEISLAPEWREFSLDFTAAATEAKARAHVDAGGSSVSFELTRPELLAQPGGQSVTPMRFCSPGRLQIDIGIDPLSNWWGTDRGLAVHRYYIEQFLSEFTSDIRGHCLEFQDPLYVPRFGGTAVRKLDILHIDGTNPLASLVADLTKPNDLPSDTFDCIVCSHVLHVILDLDRAVSELHRILKPGGVLIAAVPHISMYGEEYGEIWRFTPGGLRLLLTRAFGQGVLVRGYGNSLTAAGEIRGVTAREFLQSELDCHDSRFPVEVCARAVKAHHD